MKTFNEFERANNSEENRIKFIRDAIADHTSSADYRIALDAVEYEAQRNVTITRYKKLMYKLSGEAVENRFSANRKCASNFFNRFVTQEVSYLLGNGVQFEEESTKEALGRDFDARLYDAGKTALVQKVAFGFYNKDHVVVFGLTEFVPLYDEEYGVLKAGIRFWRLHKNSPLRVTVYEIDGYTEYKETDGNTPELRVWKEKRPYVLKTATTAIDGEVVMSGRNYPTFPIVPLWGNRQHQSELVGMQESIDCYDLIKSGFASDLEEAASLYWVVKNAGGFEDDTDLVQFLERLKLVRGAVVTGEDVSVTAHSVEIPYESREVYLTRLANDMYNDFMAVNPAPISAGNITATQIMAAYEPLNNKADEFEYCVIDFIHGILAVAGINDEPTFKRSPITNQLEQTEMIMMAADHLDEETLIRSLPFLTPDQADVVIERRIAEEGGLNRRGINTLGGEETPENNAVEPDAGI